jgi:hypothetical protein
VYIAQREMPLLWSLSYLWLNAKFQGWAPQDEMI